MSHTKKYGRKPQKGENDRYIERASNKTSQKKQLINKQVGKRSTTDKKMN
jgi:hypothetical protein